MKPMTTHKFRLLAFTGIVVGGFVFLALTLKGEVNMASAGCQETPGAGGILRVAEAKQQGVVSGVWKGTTTTAGGPGSAGLTRDITLIITEKDGKISGAYGCSSGEDTNAFCRNHDETGVISRGSLLGNKFTATITVYPDFSHCEYSGTLSDGQIRGTYTCYLGGSIAELGNWQ